MPNDTSVTNTFVASTKAKSAEVNANFTDLVNALTDGTKDLTVGTLFMGDSAKSADYTVTDTDSVYSVLMTTAGTDRTVTLPTASDNNGRVLYVKKVDSGSGACIVDGEGAETIDGATTITMRSQYDSIKIQCDGSTWHILERNIRPFAQIRLRDSTDSTGSTRVHAKNFATEVYVTGTSIVSYVNDASLGMYATVNTNGLYAVTGYIGASSGVPRPTLALNETTSYFQTNPSHVTTSALSVTRGGGGAPDSFQWTGHLNSGDVLQVGVHDPTGTAYDYSQFTIVHLGDGN